MTGMRRNERSMYQISVIVQALSNSLVISSVNGEFGIWYLMDYLNSSIRRGFGRKSSAPASRQASLQSARAVTAMILGF